MSEYKDRYFDTDDESMYHEIFEKNDMFVPYFDLDLLDSIDQEAKDKISMEIAMNYEIIPLCSLHNCLTIATCRPWNIVHLEDIRLYTGMTIRRVISTRDKILEAIERLY